MRVCGVIVRIVERKVNGVGVGVGGAHVWQMVVGVLLIGGCGCHLRRVFVSLLHLAVRL